MTSDNSPDLDPEKIYLKTESKLALILFNVIEFRVKKSVQKNIGLAIGRKESSIKIIPGWQTELRIIYVALFHLSPKHLAPYISRATVVA